MSKVICAIPTVCDVDGADEDENENCMAHSLTDRINELLDCVERPVGTMKAYIPQNPASERALVALFDAIGRTL